MKMMLKITRWILGIFIILLAIGGIVEGDWFEALLVAFVAWLVLPISSITIPKKEHDIDEDSSSFEITAESNDQFKQLGEEEIIRAGGLELSVTTQVRSPSKGEKLIKELGKKATKLKKENINAAIQCLKKIQPLLDKVSTEYPIATYLRLPLLLQQAGRMPEAEIEFNKLFKSVSNGYHQKAIYDKMRLCLQREKRFDDAIIYGVLALAHNAVGASKKKWLKDGVEEKERASKEINKLLKKAKMTKITDLLINEINAFIDNLPSYELKTFETTIRQIINKS